MRDADALLKLEPGWDFFDAGPVDPSAVAMAKRIGEVLAPLVPSYPPEYVPCADGSVQVEWHAEGWDIEVWISPAGVSETGAET